MTWIVLPKPRSISSPSQGALSFGMPSLISGAGLSLRPTFDSGTNTLTWEGPLGGGPSGPGTNYVRQSRVLTVVGGSVSSTGANTIIEGKYATGNAAINVNHNNVTVRQCFAQITPFNTDNSYCIVIAAGVTGTIIEDCFLDANADSNEGNCVGGGSLAPPTVTGCTMRRNQCYRGGQAIRYVLNQISFTENYCHQVSGADADWVECYPNGGTCDHLTIQYNYFTGPDDSVAGSDSGINMTCASGLPAGIIGPNILIDTNWFVWNSPNTGAWPFHSLVNSCTGTAGERLEFTFTNNGIYNVNGYSGAPAMFGTASGTATGNGGGLVHDSGNYTMATPTSQTGTLWPGANGSGRL